ncbi:hypothetical protein OS493_013421 [Desmophyllum pertusum]|uniref:Uncharacterized protein n=1 Tax=Desmophyllum pertusum TaxID=174260 RepID=A0A9X0CGZ8_9CNID|nr:hypothetical protein OS493_013421 [Desmophyllum pertusum]
MKIFAIAVLCLAFLCLLPFTLGEIDRYKLTLEEKGTPFLERIDVDEKQDVEVSEFLLTTTLRALILP